MRCGYVSPLLATCALPLLAPVQGSGRDFCRSPLPCTGGRRGNPPAHPASGSAEPSHDLRPCLTSAAPAAPVRPPRGLPGMFFSCSSVVLPLLAACALPLLAPVLGSGRDYCRSPLPCTGVRRGNPPRPAPRGSREGTERPAALRLPALYPPCSLAPVRPPRGPPHFDIILDMVDIPLILH